MQTFFKKLLTNKKEYDIICKHDLYAPVAQLVEHLTFNQRVRDSSSRRSTNKKDHPKRWSFLLVLSADYENHVTIGEGFEKLRPVSPSETTNLTISTCHAILSNIARRKIPAGATLGVPFSFGTLC